MSSEQEASRQLVNLSRIPEFLRQDENPIILDDLLSLPRYIYKPLDTDSFHIRLVSLHPSLSFSAVPEVTIHSILLSNGEEQKYEALSYTWGSPDDPELIIVRNSVSPLQNDFASRSQEEIWILAVTRNLDEALRHLRLKDKERILWIDAICINQLDNLEKSHQVGRMAEVYTQALRVVAWLGPEEIIPTNVDHLEHEPAGTTLAIKLLEEIGQNITWGWDANPIPTTADGILLADLEIPLPYGKTEMMSLHCLFHKSWFERLWIWQEIRLGNASSILVCGSSVISWSCFCKAIILIRVKNYIPAVEHLNFRERVSLVDRLCDYDSRSTGVSLVDLLLSTEHCKCFDPRDRIFALLSLLNGYDRQIYVEPDYTREAEDIYKEAVLKHMSYHQSVEMIARCRLAPEDRRNMRLPTWVPDWLTRGESSIFLPGLSSRFHFGSGGIRSHCSYIEPDRLVVIGVEVGIIKEIMLLDESQVRLSRNTTSYFIKRLAPTGILDKTYITGEALLDVFTKTLLLNETSGGWDPPSSYVIDFAVARDYIRKIILTSVDGLSLVVGQGARGARMMDRLFLNLESLRMFETADGLIGMAPLQMRVRDRIAMVVGFEMALVLRPIANGQDYQVVAPCYIHGFMQGKAFLGSMPEPWQRATCFHPGMKRDYDAFLNGRSGERRAEDPRLQGPYPDGWIRLSAEDNFWAPQYKNLKTGETKWRDPRLTIETIKDRGVNLKEFILV